MYTYSDSCGIMSISQAIVTSITKFSMEWIIINKKLWKYLVVWI